jgi:thiol-disulfide isomerase/thioredoxin
MTDPVEASAPVEATHSRALWPMLTLLAVAAAALIAIQMRRPKPANPFVGLSLPPVSAEGWINADRPLTVDDLHNKVVLADFWSTTCPTCVTDLPELRKLHERFRDDGLTVVGFTPESGDDAAAVREFIATKKVDWPIGYGAGFAFEMMGIQATPTYLLYDRTGQSTWGGHSLHGLDDAIIAALAKRGESQESRDKSQEPEQ